MHVVVPFAAGSPKTRLAPVLDPDERLGFARAMLEDVVHAVTETGREPTVLATESVDADVPVRVDDRPLTDTVNDVLSSADGPVAIVMADLALATADALETLFSADGDVVLAPGRGGGTNAVVSHHPGFRVDYHGVSILDHRRAAREVDADLETVDSFRLAVDVDEPTDLVEVLVHGDGRSRSFLEDAGFTLETSDGRVSVDRDSGSE
ncbi:2-phospho-L-lactate guanylyltransferase [Natrialbaceae archaeon AArc-T1-2]|uniref:2-phospho-L-lactate guanylyltransferase n=1 Tax=Natrialbaceae archaeon AArc-T1-2 TaxID=3053904 RepID=UPI00255B1B88|nr:2-phospho-L-lactate guanylyltransferase [Natrialbaceae archaeon AArc-T1-2]WIV68046.1 2-phospho-L-lactate guanylyltransferase [Natrialbaceae archaeon AArc-T1-2]